jgi:hypothetical protein
MGFGAGQIVYEDDLAAFIARETYQEITLVTVTNSTTLVDVPGSTFTVAAGATLWVDTWIAIDGTAAQDGKVAWRCANSNVTFDRNIQAAATTVATNVTIPDTIAIRRGIATAQVIGLQGGGGSSFMVYHELGICKNPDVADATVTMQMAQNAAAAATFMTVQSGYMKITRVV